MSTLSARPSGLWLLFGPILFSIWMAAVNYNNNLVYALLYLLGALSFISIFHGWRHLAPLQVRHVRLVSTFAGGDVQVKVSLHNPSRHTINGLFFRHQDTEGEETALPLVHGHFCSIEKEENGQVNLTLPAGKRGRYRFDRLVVSSLYPFGLFRLSQVVPVQTEYYIYPARKGELACPPPETGPTEGEASHPTPGDDYAGLRRYTQGDSLRQIDWKSYARGRTLAVKYFTGGAADSLWLEARGLRGLSQETQLSQLAQWVHEAEESGVPYGLRWAGREIPPGLDQRHARQILEFLACVPEEKKP